MTFDDKYIYSRCTSPITIRLVNPVTHELETREIPCGKCLHCKTTRVSEWVTRMTLQSMYSGYTYFITLTYDSSILERKFQTDKELMFECHLTYHNINKYNKWQLAPLVLCKRHTQLFWKRFRKNTGIKIQYYLVGEYGHNYGRPHYHAVVWSDEPITAEQFRDAWQYGSVDVQDIKSNSKKTGLNEMTAYRYVCKYLYKDFDFNKIPTLKYILKDYEQEKIVNTSDDEDSSYTFKDYVRIHSPFMCCSKSPAIGSRYLSQFLPEFQKGNLRIFGVHGQNLIFPRFYTRKVKESLCPYVGLSKKNGKPLSSSSTFSLYTALSDYAGSIKDYLETADVLYDPRAETWTDRIKHNSYFSTDFYDLANRVYYIRINAYNYGLYAYNKHTREYDFIRQRAVCDVMDEMAVMYSTLLQRLLLPFDNSRKFYDKEFDEYIRVYYDGDKSKFRNRVVELYDTIMSKRADRQAKYLQTKTLF